ncbi:MAG: hypothetical protein ACFHX7_17180 [Pseudomonadota bacterium]
MNPRLSDICENDHNIIDCCRHRYTYCNQQELTRLPADAVSPTGSGFGQQSEFQVKSNQRVNQTPTRVCPPFVAVRRGYNTTLLEL